MRGEHGLEAEAFMARRRFIPACAGNTRDQPLCRPNAYGSSPHARGTPIKIKINIVRLPVHPRMRGEHSIDLTTRFDRYGSSPHARGTLNASTQTTSIGTVHPRMRGEHEDCGYLKNDALTVHPRMRGEHSMVS